MKEQKRRLKLRNHPETVQKGSGIGFLSWNIDTVVGIPVRRSMRASLTHRVTERITYAFKLKYIISIRHHNMTSTILKTFQNMFEVPFYRILQI